MKEPPIKRIFKNCILKYTESILMPDGSFRFYSVVKKEVYVFTNSDNKCIKYVDFATGFSPKIKRSKSLKIIGGEEITESEYLKDVEYWKNM